MVYKAQKDLPFIRLNELFVDKSSLVFFRNDPFQSAINSQTTGNNLRIRLIAGPTVRENGFVLVFKQKGRITICHILQDETLN